MRFCIIFILFSAITVFQLGKPQQCQTGADFAAKCAKDYHGIKSGARCFFVMPNLTTWDDAWNVCASHGGTLAQIHSSEEHQSLKTYLQAVLPEPSYIWVALRRSVDAAAGCGLTNTIWYSNATQPVVNLTADRTWIRVPNAACNNRGQCIHAYATLMNVGDQACTMTFHPLCQIINPSQNYTFLPTCLNETAIQSFTPETIETCAQHCDMTAWCRSFNFLNATRTCDLFSWSIRDQGAAVMSKDGCIHYTFDQ